MHTYSNTRGMILLTTVLILSLLAALVFSMQRAMWLYMQLNQQTYLSHQAFEALEQEAFKLLNNTNNALNKSCSSKVLDVNYALLMLKAGHGCVVTENNIQYRYWLNCLDSKSKQWVIGVQLAFNSSARILLRFSSTKGLMSWRYLVD
ncbi:MAG: hypothetical protein K0U24_00820 [Gammaproteobacteria bacterium]|nr:hypothetical protein [Gammaproteobacteria bacterium]MCH9715938.1 hypothetical protein [Gammaproteobacteria bacterium]MCH9762770.1 hypothetical protein [Gammaproteobacteria bacterium]